MPQVSAILAILSYLNFNSKTGILSLVRSNNIESKMSDRPTTSRRSIPCNGKLIAKLRKQIGWSQIELAERSGFTERLIAKAESSNNIAATTLFIIAETLSEAGEKVSYQDISADPAALSKEFFQSTYKHGPKALEVNKHFISRDLVVHFAGDPNIFPFAGTHVGFEAANLAFAKFYRVIEPPKDDSEMENIHVVSTGHGALVWGETWAHPIGMPITKPMKFAIKLDFKDGLMTVFDDRFDTFEGARLFEELKDDA